MGYPKDVNEQDFKDMEEMVSGLSSSIGGSVAKISLVEFFQKVVDALAPEVAVVAGGVAFSALVEPRMTTDLDLLFSGDKAKIIIQLEKANFFKSSEFQLAKGQLTITRFLYQDRELDFLDYKNHEFQNWMIKTSKPAQTLGRKVKVVSPEALTLMKLFSNRTKDIADIEALEPIVNKDVLSNWRKKLKI